MRDRNVRLLFGLAVLSLLLALATATGAAAEETAAAASAGSRCVSDCECPPGQLCSPHTGACYVVICTFDWRPVCGLDGVTYGNACQARAAHVVVAHEGECPETCGGIQGKPCPDGEVCDLPAGECRSADLQGVCKARPEFCTKEFDPVCGCDGKTYGNDCERLRAGAQKAHDGACRKDGPAYGCQSNEDCSRRAYCQLPFGQCDGSGRCEPRPDICPFIFLPVCGCDGKTYSNSCLAANAGVSVRSDGRCP